jgi:hypothetical protein
MTVHGRPGAPLAYPGAGRSVRRRGSAGRPRASGLAPELEARELRADAAAQPAGDLAG